MRDDIENERYVRLAAYCALGLSAVNLGIMLMLALIILKGVV